MFWSLYQEHVPSTMTRDFSLQKFYVEEDNSMYT
jgi:hypothetical protein